MGLCDSVIKPKTNSEQTSNNNNLISNKKINKNFISKKSSLTQFTLNKQKIIINNEILLSRNMSNPDLIYKKIKKISNGSNSEIWLVKHIKLQKTCTMKILNKNNEIENQEDLILNEINILKNLDHPNILKIIDFFITDKNYIIITDYYPEGDLYSELIKKNRFNENEVAFIMYQLFKAVNYYQSMCIIHRDLKPENIIISNKDENGYFYIKLIDFGTAVISGKNVRLEKLIGSSHYLSPEVILLNYNEKCDIWSCGIIMYVLLIGKSPFEGKENHEIIQNILDFKFDNKNNYYLNLSNNAKDLMNKLLIYNKDQRISIKDAINHKFIQNFINENFYKIYKINDELIENYYINIINFKNNNIIKNFVNAYLVHNNIELNECFEASKLFNIIDMNGNGIIEKNEFIEGFKKYYKKNYSDNRIEEIFNYIDSDNNGLIEFEEFIRATINSRIFLSRNYLKFAFDYIDSEKNNSISILKFKEIFMKINKNYNKNNEIENIIKNIFNKINVQKDSINFMEFCQIMNNKSI
jgi:calcium-dependent protein kinase